MSLAWLGIGVPTNSAARINGSGRARVASVLIPSYLRGSGAAGTTREGVQVIHPRLLPQLASGRDRVDANFFPPRGLFARPVQRAVMSAAQRDRELVADLEAEGAGLCEANVMGVARRAPAHEARLQAHEVAMLLVAIAPWLTESEQAFIDRGDGPRRFRAVVLWGGQRRAFLACAAFLDSLPLSA